MKTISGGNEFAVAEVLSANKCLPEVAYTAAIEKIARVRDIESCPARICSTLVPFPFHGFIACLNAAFDDHRPISISPDHIWLLICQGFAQHVNANAEALRGRIVNHTDRKKLIVIRDDFVLGAMENPWENVFPEFQSQIREHAPATADLLDAQFSTTGPVEVAACQIVLLEAMKSYFEYEVHTKCGIPRIRLEGTPNDWKELHSRTLALGTFDLWWWIDVVAPTLEEFWRASKGQVNGEWWNSFYKVNNTSGGPYVTGHVLNLFPYLKQHQTGKMARRNKFINEHGPFDEETHLCFPSGLSKAPIVWKYFNDQLDLDFLAGFVGARQDAATMMLRPEIGWAVVHPNGRPKTKKRRWFRLLG